MTTTKPSRSKTASQCQSLALSPCQTPVKTSSSASCQDLNYQVSILSNCMNRNKTLMQQNVILMQSALHSFIHFHIPRSEKRIVNYCCGCTCAVLLTLAFSFSPLEPTDNANVSFVTYKGDYYVSTETNLMHKVDPETLETTKKVT